MFELNTLLVPVDFSPVSQGVFDQAVELARGDDAAIIVLHVIDPSLADLVVALKKQRGPRVSGKCRCDTLFSGEEFTRP